MSLTARNPMLSATPLQADPQPDPEPSVPSLPGPDPGVFHHDPAPPAAILPVPSQPQDEPATP